jgi:hypothetical protein
MTARRRISSSVLAGALLVSLGADDGCGPKPPSPVTDAQFQQFVFVRTERFNVGGGRWDLHVMRHVGGACLVLLDPSGDGGGSLTAVPESICNPVRPNQPVEKGK